MDRMLIIKRWAQRNMRACMRECVHYFLTQIEAGLKDVHRLPQTERSGQASLCCWTVKAERTPKWASMLYMLYSVLTFFFPLIQVSRFGLKVNVVVSQDRLAQSSRWGLKWIFSEWVQPFVRSNKCFYCSLRSEMADSRSTVPPHQITKFMCVYWTL